MQASKSLNRRVAIVLALVSMWLASNVGVVVYFHLHDWWFFDLHGFDIVTIGQIGGFFLAWAAVQFPAASIAGMIIGSSDFSHPLRATFWTMAFYHLLLSVIRAFRWPWRFFQDLDQSIPVLAYLMSVLLLVGISVFFAWFMPRFHGFVQRRSAH
jgi:hypothetical protein